MEDGVYRERIIIGDGGTDVGKEGTGGTNTHDDGEVKDVGKAEADILHQEWNESSIFGAKSGMPS